MEVIDLLKEQMKLTEHEVKEFKHHYDIIKLFIKLHKIKFDENFALGFFSHMYSFVDRLKREEKVQKVDEALENEIEAETIRLTRELLECVAKGYTNNISKDEVILAAIHIQTALSMNKEDK